MSPRKQAAQKSGAKRASRATAHSAKSSSGVRKWSAQVQTDSTHPPKDLFNQSAEKIAGSLASKQVSPKGPSSGMRMLTFYINRAGHNLSTSRRAELEKAKKLLHKKIADAKNKKGKQAA